MPELPEVESVRRTLVPRLVGRLVVGVEVRRRDVITTPTDPPGGYARNAHKRPAKLGRVPARSMLVGSRIEDINRLGKSLSIVGVDDNEPASNSQRVIVVHLGMTGQLRWIARGERVPDATHVHAVWKLDDGSRLLFRDPRRFGGLWTAESTADRDQRLWNRLGPDALAITADQLASVLQPPAHRRSGEHVQSGPSIKAALLDQARLAGVGNIYADEALFRAGLHPLRPAGSLTREETDRLAAEVRGVLSAAVELGGSTLRDYTDAEGNTGSAQHRHAVYGRSGCPCTRCGQTLQRSTIAQRTTVHCPNCQPI